MGSGRENQNTRVTSIVIPDTGIDLQSLNDLRSGATAIEDVETAWATTGLGSVSSASHSTLRVIDLRTGELNHRVAV
jgi:hypothetical protein